MYRRAPAFLIMMLIAAACSGPGADAPGAGPKNTPAAAADLGASLYGGNCAACHQQDARGVPGVYPSLVGSPVLLGEPKALVRWVIEGRRPPSMPTGRYSTVMTQFGWLKAGDASALLTYLRSHFGNAAPPVDAATVTQALGQ
jgi:aldose sugar dehydrogenase